MPRPKLQLPAPPAPIGGRPPQLDGTTLAEPDARNSAIPVRFADTDAAAKPPRSKRKGRKGGDQ